MKSTSKQRLSLCRAARRSRAVTRPKRYEPRDADIILGMTLLLVGVIFVGCLLVTLSWHLLGAFA